MIITVASSKGGVGKSTVAVNLAVCASTAGERVLLVDGDVQGSAIAWRSEREKDDIQATSILTPTLHRDLQKFSAAFSTIIIDVGGNDTGVLRSALFACDRVLVPILPSQYDIWAAADTAKIIAEAQTLKWFSAFVFFNQVIPSTIVSREAEAAMQEVLARGADLQVLVAQLCSRVIYKTSIARGLGVLECSDMKAKVEICTLYEELTQRKWRENDAGK
jgi:chromosome partitioning protein